MCLVATLRRLKVNGRLDPSNVSTYFWKVLLIGVGRWKGGVGIGERLFKDESKETTSLEKTCVEDIA